MSPENYAQDQDRLLTKREVAKRCAVCERTVDYWIKTRRIPCIKFGYRTQRFRWADVQRAIDKLEVRELQ